MNTKAWEAVAKDMIQSDKDRFIDALNTLQDWEEFVIAFGWTRLFDLKNILIWS